MSQQTVYLNAASPAAPFDIAVKLLQREGCEVDVAQSVCYEECVVMSVTIDAPDFATARGIVEGAIARGPMSVWESFAYADRPLATPPRTIKQWA